MIPPDEMNAASLACLQRGVKILQGFRLADTDEAHIAALLAFMDPPHRSSWLDIGCGFGEPARLMQQQRPDLRFELVNNNRFQLSRVPSEMSAWHADMHDLPFLNATFDGAMFLYSLCHSEGLISALREAARVVRRDGRLFVFDYVRLAGDNTLAKLHLGANFFTPDDLADLLWNAGWIANGITLPKTGSDAVFRSLFGDGTQVELYNRIFSELAPMLADCTRR